MKTGPLSTFILSAQAGIACGQRDNNGTAQLRLNNILTNGHVDFSRHIRIPSDLVPAVMLLRPGDVLFNNTNSVELVGKTSYFSGYDESVTFSNHITRLRLRTDELEPEYLALWLQHRWREKIFERICDRWIGQAAVQRSKLEALEIPVPSIADQRAITARMKLQLAEVEITRQASQVQAHDIALLRSRLLNDVFSTSSRAPLKILGNHAQTTSGSTPSRGNKRYWESPDIPWVKTGEVAFEPITRTEEAISKEALAECSLTLLPPKSVLVAMIGQGKTRGQSAILEICATTNQNCFAVLPNDTWDSEFLYYWFVANYQGLRSLSADRGGNQSALNGALLNALEVPAPDKLEQQQMVQRIKAAHAELDILNTANKGMLADLDQLPRRLLAQAFRGLTTWPD